jgi:hypothetical protein
MCLEWISEVPIPPVSLLILIPGEDSRGRAGKLSGTGFWPTNGSRPTGQMQWGIRKDLWPKYFPKCPVARHFVCLQEKHVGCHC